MSLLATFYTMPVEEVPSLLQQASPQKPRWFGKVKYPLWEHLKRWGDDVLDYDSSGFFFVSLLEYLDKIQGIDLDAFAQMTPVRELAAMGYDGGYAFAHPDAVILHSKLEGIRIDKEKMRSVVNELFGTDERHDIQGSVEALQALKSALRRVDEGKIGLLFIG